MTKNPSRLRLSKLDPARWARIAEIADRAMELAAAEVPAYLEAACGADVELRGAVDEILVADSEAGRFLDGDAIDRVREILGAPDAEPDRSNRLIGPWRVIREIGVGGMGAVYLAERADGQFTQRAAVKLVRTGWDTAEVLARFMRERQILARIEHPNVARLLDGGVTGDGLPYFAMEYVEGEPITEYCARVRPALGEMLDLFEQVGEAVQYAHRNLVVHRDLKPSNILVTPAGRVKLLDFGIAKLLADDSDAARTQTVLPMMTPVYAAPEQVRGDAPTTATDVYSLGVVLYELLTGKRPYRSTTTREEIIRAVQEETPVPPSTASGRAGLRGDIDTIVLHALRKEPEARYLSVEAFLDDLRRYRTGLPIRARNPTLRYTAAKFVRRNRAPVVAGALAVLALAIGLGAAAWQARVAARERDRARLEAAKATRVKDFTLGLFAGADPEDRDAGRLTARELVDRGAERVRTELAAEPAVQAELLDVLGTVYTHLGLYEPAQSVLERSLALRDSLFGSEHIEVAQSLLDLGTARLEQGNYDEAEPLLRRALDLQIRLKGERSSEAATAWNNLGSLLSRAGKDSTAEVCYRKAVEIDKAVHGEHSLQTAGDLNNLAVLLADRDRPAEADSLYRIALAVRERELGEAHPMTLVTMNNLAVCLESEGRLGEAESLKRRVLDLRRRHAVPDLDLASSLVSVASIAGVKGNYAEAETLLVEAQAIERRLLGADHPDVARTTNNLAILYYRQGNLLGAEASLHEAIRIWSGGLGPDHNSTLTARNSLAGVLRNQRRMEEADAIYRDVLTRRRALFGDDHVQLSSPLFGLGVLLRMKGEPIEAERALRQAVDLRTEHLGEDHYLTAEALEGLATLYREIGRRAESLALYEKALAIDRNAFSEPSLQTADVLDGMGRLLTASGRAGEAAPLLREALGIREARLSSGDARITETRAALAEAQHRAKS